jgi:2-oxoisovalerate dehydrogenase E1 component
LRYKEEAGIPHDLNGSSDDDAPIVVCSIGDAAITEGEVAEAFQMAVLKKLPIIYLVQDNEWDISASADEIRVADASEYAKGFKGLEVRQAWMVPISSTSYTTLHEVIGIVRQVSGGPSSYMPRCPLLNHHTSGVRMEFYRSAERTLRSTGSAIPSRDSCNNCSTNASNWRG